MDFVIFHSPASPGVLGLPHFELVLPRSVKPALHEKLAVTFQATFLFDGGVVYLILPFANFVRVSHLMAGGRDKRRNNV